MPSPPSRHSAAGLSAVAGDETIARLLYYPDMVTAQGRLENSAFPVQDLAKTNGRSLSVDRCALLGSDFHQLLDATAQQFADARKGRSKHGYCLATVARIRAIRDQSGGQVFDVVPDPITPSVNPWDPAHATISLARPEITKSQLRGHRDKLRRLFAEALRPFQP